MVSGNEEISIAQVQKWISWMDGVVQGRDIWTDALGASYLALIRFVQCKSKFYQLKSTKLPH